jgi:hypothetical protein
MMLMAVNTPSTNTNHGHHHTHHDPIVVDDATHAHDVKLPLRVMISNFHVVDPDPPFDIEFTSAQVNVSIPIKLQNVEGLNAHVSDQSRTTTTSCSVVPLNRVSRWNDIRLLLIFSLPNMAFVMVITLSAFFSTMFVGRLGAEYIGAFTLAKMVTNLTGNNVAQGVASALDALCSQAYGAGAYPLVGRWTQRCMLLLTLMCIPIVFIWMQTERILLTVGIESTEAALAGRFAIIATAGIWPL